MVGRRIGRDRGAWPPGRVLAVEYPNRRVTVERVAPGRYWVRAVQPRNGLTWRFGVRSVGEARRVARYVGPVGYVYG